ncbi:inhibin beta A chain-like [Saccostrea echinata]|uniref:inhibin beta A chain-like n=1 Tax=Saccostrea echinata TaxID=191078 RepID=UPI002A830428|nr:inhibin beta A chain-like [Saccostrea echinata]
MSFPIDLKISNTALWVVLSIISVQLHYAKEFSWPQTRGHQADFNLTHPGRQSMTRSINLKPEIWKDQIKRRICEIIRCNGRSVQKKNNTSNNIIFTPLRPPAFDKKDVEIVRPPVVKPKPVFSSPSDTTTDPKCMKFKVPNEYFEEDVDVLGADIYIYFKVKTKSKRRKRTRRVVLKVFSLQVGTKRKQNVAKLKVRPNDTAWYKVSLPLSVTKNAETVQNKTLSMCIDCKRCNSRTKITFPLKVHPSRRKRKKPRRNKGNKKRKQRRHTNKKRKKKAKKLQVHRPFLIYRFRHYHRSKRNTDDCSLVNNTQNCCRHEEFVSFSDLGFEQDILFPAGVSYSSCVGGCDSFTHQGPQNHSSTFLQNSSLENPTCEVIDSQETNTFIVLRDRIGILTLKNANVLNCGCVRSI